MTKPQIRKRVKKYENLAKAQLELGRPILAQNFQNTADAIRTHLDVRIGGFN